jgi:hypothetical protein
VTTEDILKREDWQANNHCLKSLFSKIPDTRVLLQSKQYKGLSTMEIEENMRVLSGGRASETVSPRSEILTPISEIGQKKAG